MMVAEMLWWVQIVAAHSWDPMKEDGLALHLSCQLVVASSWLVASDARCGLSCAAILRDSVSSKDILLAHNIPRRLDPPWVLLA